MSDDYYQSASQAPIVRGGSETYMSWSNWLAIRQSAQACLNSDPLRGVVVIVDFVVPFQFEVQMIHFLLA